MITIMLIFALVFLTIILSFIQALIKNIIVCDGIIVAVMLGVVCGTTWGVHPALCIVIGIITYIVFIALHMLKVGFWIITPIMTVSWTFFFGGLAHSLSNGDWIWAIVVGGISSLCVLGLHFKARMILNASVVEQNTNIPLE